MLDIKKIYVDTRYKTDDSISDSDFTVELPRTLNIPDNTVCYLTDVVIPVSWRTVDDRNNKLYLWFTYTGKIISIPIGNYSGPDFCAALHIAMNPTPPLFLDLLFDVSYDKINNEITIAKANRFDIPVTIVSTADLQIGKNWSVPVLKSQIYSMNGILRLGKESYTLYSEFQPYVSHIDLHTTRNLYIVSSSLANYNITSNFGNDTIVKKISVKANYAQMLFDTADAGYDFMDVSKRTLNRIDIKLIDSFGNIVDLRKNHWSFSLVFQQR